ncbi:alpha/beta fold hydrolase [Pseudomonadota bacterium]
MKTISNILTILVFAFSCNAQASDLAKEQRWADAIEDTIMDGETMLLNDGTSDFLGIFTEAYEDKQRAAIIMHGTGIHPDWSQVVRPLRVDLTEHNWHTLSIQMPILPNDAEYPEYAPLYDEVAPRINAAIEYLKEEGYKKIVLIGHSQGTAMGTYYLSKNKSDVIGFVGVSMPDLSGEERMMPTISLKTINLPILDIYGSDDLESVLTTSEQRKASAKQAGNKNYTAVVVEGADHFFKGKNKELIKETAEWLKVLDQ